MQVGCIVRRSQLSLGGFPPGSMRGQVCEILESGIGELQLGQVCEIVNHHGGALNRTTSKGRVVSMSTTSGDAVRSPVLLADAVETVEVTAGVDT